MSIQSLALWIVFSPLVASLLTGLGGRWVGRGGAHWLTITGVSIALIGSLKLLLQFWDMPDKVVSFTLYHWMQIGTLSFEIGFLIDSLTVLMMVVVAFVSLMVHIYTIGYMRDDPGYQRFFCYISLFTFAMLMLVMSNNLLQLFFGWEAVGLVSYLLIGFWYTRPSAIFANFKAFLVNRVGDFGFLIGIGLIVVSTGSLNYAEIFAQVDSMSQETLQITGQIQWPLLTTACIGLFVGAMGKSAQVPLHVWLPDSMEGPTPISALIHAATMVTAGIFMVARLSPVFEASDAALSFILVIGATTAFFMGLIGVVQNDIKRVVAYSTLSQLGYMTVALGASAYSVAIFHLFTHAFFKALLFLAAGSVIIAMHHEQDMRKMGGLMKKMPITGACAWIGTVALIGMPGFAGFFSKESIIEAVSHSQLPWAEYAYWMVLCGVAVTAFYSLRLMFMVFHGESRTDSHTAEHLHESPSVVTLPLILLAIPSVIAGFWLGPIALGEYLQAAIFVDEVHASIATLTEKYHGPFAYIAHSVFTVPFYLMLAGILVAWLCYVKAPRLPGLIQTRLRWLYTLLEQKYGFDIFYINGVATLSVGFGKALSRFADQGLIDGLAVNGSARVVRLCAAVARKLQTGLLYHYALLMIFALIVLLYFFYF